MITKSTKSILTLALALVLLTVAGTMMFFVLFIKLNINVRDPKLQSPIQFTQILPELSPTNIATAQEITYWHAPDANFDVVALSQPISGEKLLAVYENGKFRSWNINEQKVINEYDFISASTIGVNFSADGSWVITPGMVTPDGVNGYNVWKTDTGKRVECWGAQCPNDDLDDLTHFNTGILLEPNKKLIVEYIGYTVNASGIPEGVSGVLRSIDNLDDPNKPEILRMTMDNSGKYLAYALADGTVAIREASRFLGFEDGVLKGKYYRYANDEDAKVIADLEFDNTRRWLALLSNKELTIWDLTAYFSPEIKVSVKSGNSIAFDHNGKIAIVGTDNGMLLINLITGQKIAEYDVGKVTALYFTRDNRLLVWCDENAGIHLWGVSGN